MNRKERRRQERQTRKSMPARAATSAVKADFERAIALHQAGRAAEALPLYHRVLSQAPRHAKALNFGGLALFQTGGDLDQALAMLDAACAADRRNAAAHNNRGLVLQARGALDQAETAFRRTLAIDGRIGQVHNNLGIVLQAQGRFDRALAAHRKALALDGTNADAHNNLGNALKALGEIDAAVDAYRRAIALTPNAATAHANLGVVLVARGDTDEGVALLQRAVALAPDAIETRLNLGAALYERGDCRAALDALIGVVRDRPDNDPGWRNLGFALAVVAGEEDRAVARRHLATVPDPDPARPAFALNAIERLSGEDPMPSYDAAVARLPSIDAETVSTGPARPGAVPWRPERVAALVHFGRSGSGFLHSLIDGHSRVATLPGAYMKGFFGPGLWRTLTAGGDRRGLIAAFVAAYDALFDATSTRPVPGDPGGDRHGVGVQEGFTTMGEHRDRALTLDRAAFADNLDRALDGLDRIDQGGFFAQVHAAFEATLGRGNGDESDRASLLFYHIHNPNSYEFSNFLKYFPDTTPLMIVREPIQACASWIADDLADDGTGFGAAVAKITTMLMQIDRPEFRRSKAVALRLEDLKTDPEATLGVLCAWLGIDDEAVLRRSTMQGLRWWGEPNGSMFGRADPFDPTPLRRRADDVFSARDRRVLEALFHPFSERFGYAGPARADLDGIAAAIDEPFDFERAWFARRPETGDNPLATGTCRYLRVVLRARLATLRAHGTYPGMIAPLPPVEAARIAEGGRW